MSTPRLAAWIIGAAVCGAWLASAAGVTRQVQTFRPAPRPPDVVQLDALAADVQAQAGRLRQRLAQAPTLPAAERNPFRFATSTPTSTPRRPAIEPSTPDVAEVAREASEPALQLIGIAESQKADGVVRTAMITGEYGELMMVTAGQRILSRYDVVAVGADAVELRDVDTGASRRLILR
jgi:hypothetical protein